MTADPDILPPQLSFGTSVGVRYDSTILTRKQGDHVCVARHSQPTYTYSLNYENRDWAEHAALLAFFTARLGPSRSFKLFDYLDNSTAADGEGAPSSTDQACLYLGQGRYQLMKNGRAITAPDVGTVVASAAPVSIDYDRGQLVYAGDVGPVTAGCRFHVRVKFARTLDGGMGGSLQPHRGDIMSVSIEEVKPDFGWVTLADGSTFGESTGPRGGMTSIRFPTDIDDTLPSGGDEPLILEPGDSVPTPPTACETEGYESDDFANVYLYPYTAATGETYYTLSRTGYHPSDVALYPMPILSGSFPGLLRFDLFFQCDPEEEGGGYWRLEEWQGGNPAEPRAVWKKARGSGVTTPLGVYALFIDNAGYTGGAFDTVDVVENIL